MGDFGTILHTITGGGPATWTLQASGTSNHLRGLSFVDASTGTAVGDSGTGNPLTGVSFIDANTGCAVGLFGTILSTTDGGATWPSQVSGTVSWLSGVSFVDVNIGTAVGSGGTILRTTDRGTTWRRQASGQLPLGGSFLNAEHRGRRGQRRDHPAHQHRRRISRRVQQLIFPWRSPKSGMYEISVGNK